MLMTIERPKDKGEIQRCEETRYQVDRYGEVVVGSTTERVVKARVVCPKERRGDVRDAKGTRGVPSQ